ncbi:MAG: TIGR02996 domain-containing protein [Gemmataceae bacterium]
MSARPELLSLLEACKREPEEDAPRLVLADWLEEHGEEDRAEFLRLEATSGHARGRPAFIWLRHLLWSRGCDRWAPFQPALQKNGSATPDGGLISAQATPKAPTSPRGLRWAGTEAWAWVERLAVSPGPGDLPGLLGSALLETVRTLDLSGAKLTAGGVAALAGSPRLATLRGLLLEPVADSGLLPLLRSPHAAGLRRLDLGTESELMATDYAALSEPGVLPNLERLAFHGDRYPSEEVVDWIYAAPRPLRELSFSTVGRLGRAPLADAEHLRGVRRLGVPAPTTAAEVTALVASPLWHGLEELHLGEWAAMTPPAAALLARGPHPRRLLRLALAPGNVPEVLRAVLASPLCGALDYLCLVGSRPGPGWVEAVTAMPAAPHALYLGGWPVGDDGLAALARWPGLRRCRALLLSEDEVTEAGMKALADSPHAGGLTGLWLGGRQVTVRALEALLRAPWLGGLEALELWGAGFERASRPALVAAAGRLPRLRELRLGETLLSDAIRSAFAHVPYVG